MSEIVVLQHAHAETLGTIADALDARGLTYNYVRGYIGETIPRDLGDTKGLILMGGPMGVYELDKFHFLIDEMHLIEQALRRGVPVLGVCLGSQLLASVLGSEVHPGPAPEIGWYPVTLSEFTGEGSLWNGVSEKTFMGFHWHGDVFDPPAGSVVAASSEMTPCQAFRDGKSAFGILAHLEVTAAMIQDWTRRFKTELAAANIDPAPILAGIPDHLSTLQHIGRIVYGNWVDLIVERRDR